MKAEIIQEYGFKKYFAIRITDLTKSVCGKKEITLRVAQYEYSNGCDMVSIFNEIAQRINFFEGENK